MLVSSTIVEADVLAAAAREDVLLIKYDAGTTSLVELAEEVRSTLGKRKALSIGFAVHDYGEAKFYLTGSETISLGSTLVSENQREFWRELGSMLEEKGRIDLFACDLASSRDGLMLVSALEEVSGVKFAASSDRTGNAKAGGNWLLETGGTDAGNVYFDFGKLAGFSGLLAADETKLLADDGAASDYFGYSVSISGDYMVVGAYGDDDKGVGSGSAYIFKRSGTSWSQQAKLTASDGASNDWFGYSVSISGNYVVVGAPQDDDNGNVSGSAYIFLRSGTSWSQQAKLLATGGATGDYFGDSVSISGDYAVVGAPYDDDKGSTSGSAYIFYRSGTSWNQQAQLLASDGAADDYFGDSVSISGDYAVVGAWEDDDKGSDSGSACVFKRSGTSWSQQAKLTASDGSADDAFGWSVSISGDYAVVGASYDGDKGYQSGSAYVFLRSGTSWSQQAKLIASDGTAEDRFGRSVSISSDYAVVGAYSDDTFRGSAYVFHRSGTTWSQQAKLIASDRATYDYFGESVSVAGDYAVVGAWYDDDKGSSSGSAYVYKAQPPDLSLPHVEDITYTSATLGATVDEEGWRPVTERGVVWSTWSNPTTGSCLGSATATGTLGDFTVDATSLTPGTTYHYRGYAINALGTGYTEDATFTTVAHGLPVVIEPTASGIGAHNATLGANVIADGGTAIVARGVVWDTSPGTTLGSCLGSAAAAGGLGAFTVSATGLSPGATYHFRGYATNAAGTTYTAEATFTTPSLGSLQVTIEPAAARTAGAAWRRVGTAIWHPSGHTETGLYPGTYTIEFKMLEGWTAPENRSVTVSYNSTTSITARYRVVKDKSGSLRITLGPDSAVKGGAMWRVAGGGGGAAAGGWRHSGETVTVIAGKQKIEFLPVPGWYCPPVEIRVRIGKLSKVECECLPFLVSACTDFDGDGDSDVSCFRPSDNTWRVKDLFEVKFGEAGCWPAAGDYDGDGVADIAYWSPKKGLWRVKGGLKLTGFGAEGDLPVPADYDGDGITDPALYRPSTGEWFIAYSDTPAWINPPVRTFIFGGKRADIPVPGNYLGFGKADFALYNIDGRNWQVLGREDLRYGRSGDMPMPADYNGDGIIDISVLNMQKGQWRAKGLWSEKIKIKAGDVPVPGDYDGNGAAEIALYRYKNGKWYLEDGKIRFGTREDIPLVR